MPPKDCRVSPRAEAGRVGTRSGISDPIIAANGCELFAASERDMGATEPAVADHGRGGRCPTLSPISLLPPAAVALTGRLLEEAGRESADSGRVAAAEEGRVVAVDLAASWDAVRESGRVLPGSVLLVVFVISYT